MGDLFAPKAELEEDTVDPEEEKNRAREIAAVERLRQGRDSLVRNPGVFVPDPE